MQVCTWGGACECTFVFVCVHVIVSSGACILVGRVHVRVHVHACKRVRVAVCVIASVCERLYLAADLSLFT